MPRFARYNVTNAQYNNELGHNIPNVFQSYLTGMPLDWVFVMGYPITEPYWTRASVGGQMKDVLVQSVRAPHPDLHAKQPGSVPGGDGQCRSALLSLALRRRSLGINRVTCVNTANGVQSIGGVRLYQG